MTPRRSELGASPGVPLPTALITWVPIAVGTILGAILRLVLLLFGGGRLLAALGSVLCSCLGVAAAILWLRGSGESAGWAGTLRLGATWVLLTMLFRAAGVGLLLGAGWAGVMRDYSLGAGQPLLFVLAIVGLAPLTLGRCRHRPMASPERRDHHRHRCPSQH